VTTRYFANVGQDLARLKPDVFPFAIRVLSDPAKPDSIVGIVYGAGQIGGWRTDFSRPGFPSEDLGLIETIWRLKIGKNEVEGRFALRMGELVKLGEEAV
jgi:hypothetical protein